MMPSGRPCMRLSGAWLVASVATVMPLGSARGIQQPVATSVPSVLPFKIPPRLLGLTLLDSAIAGSALAFSYQGNNVTKLDVFVYALPPDDKSRSGIHKALMKEVESFKQSLPIGVSRGWYDEYRVAVDKEDPVQVGQQVVPGHAVAMVFVEGGSEYVSLFCIHALRGMFIKIRLTVPAGQWDLNPALDFPTRFVEYLVSAR